METYRERFWSKVIKSDDCWGWAGFRTPAGYPQFAVERRIILGHRAAWILTNGPIPDGLCVLHRCDNRACANPAHLFLGTKGDNSRDMCAKGRAPTQVDPSRVQGENHPRAKLTAAEVVSIREEYARGGVLFREIAKEYGMSVAAIQHLINGRSWACLPVLKKSRRPHRRTR